MAIIVDDEPEFEISEILNSKHDNRRHACKLLYLVHWSRFFEALNERNFLILTSKLRHASQNSLRISTLPIQPSLVLCQVFDLGNFTSI